MRQKCYQLITLILWWNISILMPMVSSRMTVSPISVHKGSLNGWWVWKHYIPQTLTQFNTYGRFWKDVLSPSITHHLLEKWCSCLQYISLLNLLHSTLKLFCRLMMAQNLMLFFFPFNLSLCTLYNEYMITKLCITCIFYNQSTDTAALSYRLFHAECPYHLILKIKLLNEVWIWIQKHLVMFPVHV